MAHPIPPYFLVPPRTAAVVRVARARLSAATAAAGALAAGSTLLLTPRAAHASDTYAACLEAVYALAERCLKNSDNLLGDFACAWLGGLGYICCAVLEALKQLIPSGGLNIT